MEPHIYRLEFHVVFRLGRLSLSGAKTELIIQVLATCLHQVIQHHVNDFFSSEKSKASRVRVFES